MLKHTYSRSLIKDKAKKDSPETNTEESFEERIKGLQNDIKALELELNKKMDHIDAQTSAYNALQRELGELQVTNGLLQTRLDEAGELITE